jgi:hypothetical protein
VIRSAKPPAGSSGKPIETIQPIRPFLSKDRPLTMRGRACRTGSAPFTRVIPCASGLTGDLLSPWAFAERLRAFFAPRLLARSGASLAPAVVMRGRRREGGGDVMALLRTSKGWLTEHRLRNDRVQVPGLRNALELVLAAILELDPRAGDKVLDGA